MIFEVFALCFSIVAILITCSGVVAGFLGRHIILEVTVLDFILTSINLSGEDCNSRYLSNLSLLDGYFIFWFVALSFS